MSNNDQDIKSAQPKRLSRIQKNRRQTILNAALKEFAEKGYHGATLDQIAHASKLSKPNILYYFSGKEEIYVSLLKDISLRWITPLGDIDSHGDPEEELIAYMLRLLELSLNFPEEQRLFSDDLRNGATFLSPFLEGEFKGLFESKLDLVRKWSDAGLIAAIDPWQLFFSMWASTQYFADFQSMINISAGKNSLNEKTSAFLEKMFRRLVASSK